MAKEKIEYDDLDLVDPLEFLDPYSDEKTDEETDTENTFEYDYE